LLFSVVIGSGIQCFWMSFSTISFAALGFLSPANRGSFITAFLVLFILLGSVGGFFSARMYKTLNGTGYVPSRELLSKSTRRRRYTHHLTPPPLFFGAFVHLFLVSLLPPPVTKPPRF
jgi:hypothetical protein